METWQGFVARHLGSRFAQGTMKLGEGTKTNETNAYLKPVPFLKRILIFQQYFNEFPTTNISSPKTPEALIVVQILKQPLSRPKYTNVPWPSTVRLFPPILLRVDKGDGNVSGALGRLQALVEMRQPSWHDDGPADWVPDHRAVVAEVVNAPALVLGSMSGR